MADYQQNFLASLHGGMDFGQRIKQQRDQSQLNQLAAQSYSTPPEQRDSLLAQMAGVDAGSAFQAEKQMAYSDERRNTNMVNMARLLTNAPPQARAGLYRSMVPTLSRFGLSEMPQEYNDQTAPVIDKAAQSIVQAYQGGGTSSQNKVIGDALVGPQGNILYQAERQPEYMWSDRAGAWIPSPNNALISQRQGHAQGTPANPLEQGGTQAQVDADAALANEMIAAGISDAQVDAFLAARMNPNGGSAVAALPSSLEPVRVAGVGPKPEISAAEQMRLDMAGRAANRADEAAREASAARQEAADQRRRGEEEKRQKADMAAQQAISSVTDSLGTIQRLRNHPGYRQLGTVMGDAALSTPLIRTDAKGANALLETIKSQMLINTLQSLKAASSTGASGFGSLTEREGDALRAAIANLTTAQSHEDLDSAIGQVENVLTRSQRQLSASAPRQAAPDRPQTNAIPQRARNPQTGQVIELRNGQWVPVQ
ncbi:hypothetical protein [Stenotrophomonas sp. UBA7606]|uniref:hypothetical protein n=1 Tax=Stenotrophomonas sp. UBA7606 TaxID=1947559 RepID=UPI0025F1BA55|nr:hypothetical protein [Stenotrophomonas sp. UBA7606]